MLKALHSSNAFRILSLVLLVATTGCTAVPPPKNQEEAGSVNVAATLVAPWDEYIGALTPTFTLSSNDAVNKVMPRTGILEEKILDALGVSARVGLPQTSEAITRSITAKTTQVEGEDSKETRTTSEDSIQKKEPGKLPDMPSKAQGGDKGVKDLPGAPSDAAKGLRNDPILEYTAATALYQEVQLLNRYVTDAALRHGMSAYIVRLQIGVVPYRKSLAYDIYTKIGFFPKDSNGKDEQAYVLPLLVTDNLDAALASRAQDTIRQLSLAISVMKAGIVGTAGIDRISEAFESQLFSEFNSLFTIGRITNNTLGARLGASRQGKDQYSIVPRTHNVTVVVMVPSRFGGKDNEVRVVAKTSMRSVQDGTLLPQPERSERVDNVRRLVKTFLAGQPRKDNSDTIEDPMCEDPDKGSNANKKEAIKNPVSCSQALLQSVWANKANEYDAILDRAGWQDRIGRFSRDLWMEIVESLDRSQFSGVRFQLPNKNAPVLPQEDQVVLLVDDGKNSMRTTLVGGQGLLQQKLRAILRLKLDGDGEAGKSINLPGTIATENGVDLTITFPSPTLWKLGKLDLEGAMLELIPLSDNRWSDSEAIHESSYKTIRYRKSEETVKPVFSVKQGATLIQPDASHQGTASIYVEFSKDAKKNQLAKHMELNVDGADIMQAQIGDKGKSEKRALVFDLGKIIVPSDGTIDISFRNLTKTKKITIKPIAKDKEDKVIAGDQADIIFEIAEAQGKN